MSENMKAILAIIGLGALGGAVAGATFFGLAWWALAGAAS